MPYRLFPSDRFAFRRPAALLCVRIVVAQAEPRGLGARVVADGVVHAAARAEERRGPRADGARVRRERAVGAPGAPVACGVDLPRRPIAATPPPETRIFRGDQSRRRHRGRGGGSFPDDESPGAVELSSTVSRRGRES